MPTAAFWKIDSFRAATGEAIEPGEEIEITADDLVATVGELRERFKVPLRASWLERFL